MDQVLIIDTETGGLDPDTHSLLSLAALIWTPTGVTAEMEVFVKEPELNYDQEAVAVNRIDIDWIRANGVEPQVAVERLEDFLRHHWRFDSSHGSVRIAGHNVYFDVLFLNRLYRLAHRNYRAVFSHRLLDTASIIQFLVLAGRLPLNEAGSDSAFAHFGITIPKEERHTALGDARATAALLSRLIQSVR